MNSIPTAGRNATAAASVALAKASDKVKLGVESAASAAHAANRGTLGVMIRNAVSDCAVVVSNAIKVAPQPNQRTTLKTVTVVLFQSLKTSLKSDPTVKGRGSHRMKQSQRGENFTPADLLKVAPSR